MDKSFYFTQKSKLYVHGVALRRNHMSGVQTMQDAPDIVKIFKSEFSTKIEVLTLQDISHRRNYQWRS